MNKSIPSLSGAPGMQDHWRTIRSRAVSKGRNRGLEVRDGNIIVLAICSAYFHGFGLNAIQKIHNGDDNRQPHKLITVIEVHKFVIFM